MPLEFTPVLKRDLEPIIAEGVFTYISEFAQRLFPDHAVVGAQDCMATGIADAIRRYENQTGIPIAQTIAQNLIDKDTK